MNSLNYDLNRFKGFKGNVLMAGNIGKIYEEYEENLRSLGFNVLKTIKADFLYDSIAYHPDIVIHPADDNSILVEKSVTDYYRELFKDIFKETDKIIVPTESKFTSDYPGYSGLNIGRVGNCYIHNNKYTDKAAINIFSDLNLEKIEVKQGYSKCSTLTISYNAVITTDRGIERAIIERNRKMDNGKNIIDVLYIDPEGINLDGMNYGFIGGCGGMVSEKDLILTGTFDHMNDSDKIYNYLDKYGISVIYLSDNGINDIGGIMYLGE